MPKNIVTFFKAIQPIVAAVGALGSIVTAVVAILIQQDVAAQSAASARVDRSVSIASILHSDPLIVQLQRKASKIEVETLSIFDRDTGNYHTSNALVIRNNFKNDPEFRASVSAFLQHMSRVARCGAPGGDMDAISDSACDANSMIYLVGETALDIYFRIRPTLLCDDQYEGGVDKVVEFVDNYASRFYPRAGFSAVYGSDIRTNVCGVYDA